MTENIDKKDTKEGENNSETLNVTQTDVEKTYSRDKNKKEIECQARSKNLHDFLGVSKTINNNQNSNRFPLNSPSSATLQFHNKQKMPEIQSRNDFKPTQDIILLDIKTYEASDLNNSNREEYGTQRVYKKTSPNCVLTLYLPTREISLTGNSPTVLRGIVYVDPNAIQGCRIYAQLTLTFRYGREDEEVMGLRFCNEAIMSLHQIWPYNEEISSESLSPLQEALITRLGEGAHPFILTLSSRAPPSVQLVPAKRYYGAPIGTSYDVRCFIADRTDEKFQRRASVKMGIRVIYRANLFEQAGNSAENFATFINTPCNSPPVIANDASPSPSILAQPESHKLTKLNDNSGGKIRKSEKSDSFAKLRLSPKSFRFSGRFGRSKSEIEKCPTDPLYHYSKSFQEYESAFNCRGPYGSVDKPFLLQDGRVSLRANLDKAWYTHGEEVRVTVNIRNDSRKTVRKIRVCAIQHVDVCMFNNGKFKNVVADTDADSDLVVFQPVPPGDTFNTTIKLKPQRGQTKNWIALEDTLQRSTEPDEITGVIAASAVRSFNMIISPTKQKTKTNCDTSETSAGADQKQYPIDDKNVFAIYVSYYVKVKLHLSSMGGELSLKLPFVLVHVNDQTLLSKLEKLALSDMPPTNKSSNNQLPPRNIVTNEQYLADDISSMSDINIDNFNETEVSQQELDKLKKYSMARNSTEFEQTAEDATKSFEQVHTVQIHHQAN